MARAEAILLAALGYARLGYRVLPLHPGGKRPHGGLAPHGLKDATADPTIVRSWWDREPRAGVGLLAPENVLVLDFDLPEAWQALRREHPELLQAPRQRTPKGGVHLFLRLPEGLQGALSASTRALPGIDIRGLARAYVAAWPTRLSNGGYYWEVGLKTPGELPPVPSALLQRLLPPPPPPVRLEGASRPSASPERLRKLLDYHASRIASTPEGSRHLELLRRGLAVAGLVPLGLDREEAEAALREAGLAAGLPLREVEDLLRWVLPRGEARPLALEDRLPEPKTYRARVYARLRRWA
ncbi:bifunctional DNA primase/polymerase [Thermus caliditerrae]|uniref:bifunctional DNA primase/polymerase n=1 Tax=Thermus caliditerrae TaxID=1330700 RepID=UPI001F25C718|nr:bifunctional DNA primase/polymerase [Thermus caliditerrae]